MFVINQLNLSTFVYCPDAKKRNILPISKKRKLIIFKIKSLLCFSPHHQPCKTPGIIMADNEYFFIISRKGGIHLVHDDFIYRSNLKRQGRQKDILYWECIHNRSIKCRGRMKSVGDSLFVSNGSSESQFLGSFFRKHLSCNSFSSKTQGKWFVYINLL